VDTVRLARDLSDVSGLLPAGITRLRDIPFTLLQAIKAALIFLSFEELPAEDVPPRSVWTNTEELNAHFDRVRRRQQARYQGHEPDDEQRNAALDLLIAS
jgi:hypothetical protein